MSFADELAEALDDIRAEFGTVATYHRGATAIPLGSVTRGVTMFKFIGDEGETVRTQTVDWIFEFSALTDGNLPLKGNRITEVIGSDTHTYEVSSVNGEPCWRWSDPKKTTIRVHTLFLSKAPTA